MCDTDNTPCPEDTPPCCDAAPAADPTPCPEEVVEATPMIQYDDFVKVQLRVARVIEVAEHPNADRLIVLKVDLGDEQRTICAGIKANYAPEELLGKNVVVVANLAPRKLRGIESHGMLLAATDAATEDVVVLTTDKVVGPGSSVR
jgi:methionine--tRNA ligase beta chain